MEHDYSDTTVIIPTLNEEDNIGKLLNYISNTYRGIKVIVADDGSTDDTKNTVLKFSKDNTNIRFLDRANSAIHGITASVLDAAKLVDPKNIKNILVIDGDFQHPPKKIKDIIYALQKADIVIAIRKKITGSWGAHRKAMSKVATFLGKTRLKISGLQCNDPLSGFFGIKANLFRAIAKKHSKKFEMKGYKILFDLLKYLPSESNLAQVAYTFNIRNKGESKIKLIHMWYFLRSLFR